MRRPLTPAVALALALAPPLLGQFDPHAPEPPSRLRGRVILSSRGEIEEVATVVGAAREVGSAQVLRVAVRGEDAVAMEEAWRAAGAAGITTVGPGIPEELLAELLGEVAVVWLEAPTADGLLTELPVKTLAAGLRSVLDRGGVVGAAGAAAEALGVRVLGTDAAGLGAFPRACIETRVTRASTRSERMRLAMEEDPGLVGITVGAGSTLVLRERWLASTSQAWAFVEGANGEPPTARVLLSHGRPAADLVTLARIADARHRRRFPPERPGAPVVPQGSLMICGGGRLPRSVLEHFIELAGGPDAGIVYVPCEYAEHIPREPGFVRLLRDAGAREVTWIHTKDRAAADSDPALLDPLRTAGGIWFGGGRQWNFVDSYLHTEAHRLMHGVLERGGVIGGSSAGASIQAEFMARGGPLGNVPILVEGYEEGLGFLPGVAVDQHFTERGRLPDLLSLVERRPAYLGLGLDEAAVVEVHGAIATISGANVTVAVSSPEENSEETSGVACEVLAPGARYDLAARRRLPD